MCLKTLAAATTVPMRLGDPHGAQFEDGCSTPTRERLCIWQERDRFKVRPQESPCIWQERTRDQHAQPLSLLTQNIPRNNNKPLGGVGSAFTAWSSTTKAATSTLWSVMNFDEEERAPAATIDEEEGAPAATTNCLSKRRQPFGDLTPDTCEPDSHKRVRRRHFADELSSPTTTESQKRPTCRPACMEVPPYNFSHAKTSCAPALPMPQTITCLHLSKHQEREPIPTDLTAASALGA